MRIYFLTSQTTPIRNGNVWQVVILHSPLLLFIMTGPWRGMLRFWQPSLSLKTLFFSSAVKQRQSMAAYLQPVLFTTSHRCSAGLRSGLFQRHSSGGTSALSGKNCAQPGAGGRFCQNLKHWWLSAYVWAIPCHSIYTMKMEKIE